MNEAGFDGSGALMEGFLARRLGLLLFLIMYGRAMNQEYFSGTTVV